MRFNSSFIVIFFFLSLTMVGFSCKTNNGGNGDSDSTVAQDVIYYFPEKNIYYDSQRANYYYSLDGTRSWDSLQYKGPAYGAVLGSKVAIERTENNIWANNEFHRQQHNGVLLNIINKQTVAISKADSISKSKPFEKVKPVTTVKEEADEEPKKGLKKFFNKLFGKKKKPAEEKKQ
ncbi:MAG: hypothetical protein ABIN01_15080 [Ferruginibacter sp.]